MDPLKSKIELIFIFLFVLNQIVFAQFCYTRLDNTINVPENETRSVQTYQNRIYEPGIPTIEKHYIVPVHVKVFRETNGTGGPPASDVDLAIQLLKSDLKPYNIRICLGGISYVNDSYMTGWIGPFDQYDDLESGLYKESGYITIYLFDSNTWNGGSSFSYVSDHLLVGGNYNYYNPDLPNIYPNIDVIKTSVVTHEFGHCLGLYHTHHKLNGIADFPGNPNCATTGDGICDTPPDIDMNFQVTFPNCQYRGTNWEGYPGYHGDTHNYMAYTHPNCMSNFTSGQAYKMYDQMENNPILEPLIEEVSFSGPDELPVYGSGSFTVSTESSLPTSWSVSPNIRIVEVSGNTITVSKNTSCSGKGWVKCAVNLSNGCDPFEICREVTINQNVLAGLKTFACGSTSPVCDPMGIPECQCNSQAAFSLYPNPASDEVTIEMTDLEVPTDIKIEVLNLIGEKLLEKNLNGKIVKLNLTPIKMRCTENVLLINVLKDGKITQRRLWIN